MTFESFKELVRALIAKAGGKIKVDFSVDPDKGKYIACADGVIISASSTALKLSVRWGYGHQAMIPIAEVA